jgi:hypothetical protein
MFQAIKKILLAMLVASLVIAPLATSAPAQEYFEKEDPSGASMLFDTIMVRPIGIVATAVGAVFYVVSLPFSALGDNVGEAGEKLIKEPAKFTFQRPLGEF